MESDLGFETHPLSHLYFFESEIPSRELDGKRIALQFNQRGICLSGVFEIHTWQHPELPQFTAMTARSYSYSATELTSHRIVFDSTRAAKIRRAEGEAYQYIADLGELSPLEQVPAVWEKVRVEYDDAILTLRTTKRKLQ